MQENTNKAIALNSMILYGRMAITTICALLTTRFALQALGVVDFGLYAVLGGIISFISIFNTIMLSTSNRFIAVALGKGDMEETNKQFNVNLIVHISIAIFVLLIAFPVGQWYIPHYVNYEGPIENAMIVFFISIIGSVLSFVGVPYNGLLMAKEKFIVFSLVDVVAHFLKLIVAWILISHFVHKLIIYTVAMALFTALHTVVYILYCSYSYPEIVHLKFVREKRLYKNVFNFSTWVAIGAVSTIGKSQGAALIVNAFFSTVMNTAMGIAANVNQYVSMFAYGVVQPMQPQITKSYAAGNKSRTDELLIMSTKYSFLLTFLVSSILLSAPEWILSLWLGNVPPYASIFLVLFIIDQLVQSFNSGISNIIWADGNLVLYQLLTSSLNVLAVVAGYFVLLGGAPAYFLTVAYICFSVIRFFAIQWTLHHTLNYDNRILWKNSYLPSFGVVVSYLPVFFMLDYFHPAIKILLSLLYLSLLMWFIGLNKKERYLLYNFLRIRL